MLLSQLRQEIHFESGIGDIDSFETYIDTLIGEIFDKYCQHTRYDDLYIQDTVIVPTAANEVLTLPADLQVLDIEHVRFREDNDSALDIELISRKGIYGENEGPPRYIIRNQNVTGALTSVAVLRVFPYSEIATGDRFVINYWRKPSAWISTTSSTVDNAVLLPDVLIPTVKAEAIARCSLLGDGKKFKVYREIARDAHTSSYGAIDLGPI